jgi:Cu/Ag efflux pump CusA
VTYKVEEALNEIRKTLPQGVQLDTQVFRQANFIESSITNLRRALIEGAVVVTIVVVFFLFNVRASFITLTAMPLSLLMGILILKVFGVGINAMTLGGLAVAIGAVVDDAIIDVENIFRRLRQNRQKPNPELSLKVIFNASREIRIPIVYATLIILVVFGPIFFFSGVEGASSSARSCFDFALRLLVVCHAHPVLCSFSDQTQALQNDDKEEESFD